MTATGAIVFFASGLCKRFFSEVKQPLYFCAISVQMLIKGWQLTQPVGWTDLATALTPAQPKPDVALQLLL
jgi:hypothetical protein